MTQTEAALRLARHLLTSHRTTGDVHVSLTGRELSRRNTPLFPVQAFLAERACLRVPVDGDDEWTGPYIMRGVPHALALTRDPHAADVVAPLTCGRRLVAHVSRGVLRSSRGTCEHTALRTVIGRALTFSYDDPTDIPAAVIPRSPRTRMLAARWRELPLIARTSLLILTVDRTGSVDGLPDLQY